MREIRPFGSEGGVAQINAPSLPLSCEDSGLEIFPLLKRRTGELEDLAGDAKNRLSRGVTSLSCPFPTPCAVNLP